MDAVFKALADPTRRHIIDILAEQNDQPLFNVCVKLAMNHSVQSSRQAITKHLAILEAAGLVQTVKSGRYKLLHLHKKPLSDIMERWLSKI